jgi:hypothetical protein
MHSLFSFEINKINSIRGNCMELFQHKLRFGSVYIPADIPFHHRQFSDDGTTMCRDPLTCADPRLKILYSALYAMRNAKHSTAAAINARTRATVITPKARDMA